LPEDVYRDPLIKLPDPMNLDLEAMMAARKGKEEK
jgi:hypothetical protein